MASQNKYLLYSQMGKLPSPQMQRKVQQMIRKKASLYGLSELANPLFHNNHKLLFSSRLKNQNQHIRSKSTLGHSTNIPTQNNTNKNINDEIQNTKAPVIPLYKLDSKTNLQKLFPKLTSFKDLINDQKQILYVFRDKLDYDINDVVFQYLKILQLAINYQSQTFSHKISPSKGFLITTLQFLAQSFLECQFQKIVLFICVIGINLCQFYKQLDRIGKFLFLISKVLRKMFKFQECLLMLKKALEYVWYGKSIHHLMNEQKHKKPHNHQKHGQYKQKQHKDKREAHINNLQRKLTQNNAESNYHHNHNKIEQKQSNKQPHLKSINMQDSHQQQNQQNKRHINHQYRHESNPSNNHQSYQSYLLKLLQEYTNTQLEIYSQLSYCLLQLNKKQESKIFGQKYQIGYLQKQSSSSVMILSKDMINSAQKKIIAWQRVDKRRFDLIFGIQLDKYLIKYEQVIKNKFQQLKFINALKVNIDLLIENLFKKDMFFYQVPLITDFKDKQIQIYKNSHHKLPILTQKFVYKKKSFSQHGSQRSSSIPTNLKKFKNDNVGQNKIFNYRGVGLSRSKLTNIFRDYIHFIEIKLGYHLSSNKLPPVKQIKMQENQQTGKNHKTTQTNE